MLAFLAALVAPLALAAPLKTFTARAVAPWCDGLGPTARDTPAGNFTLGALNIDGERTNVTGAPLVLGQAGAIHGASFEILSTWNSFPYNQWPSLGLIDGRLYANNNYGTPTYSSQVLSGSYPSFVTTSQAMTPPPQQYCIVTDSETSQDVLAVKNRVNLFSLCKTGTSPLAQNNVVFDMKYPPPEGTVCYPVLLTVLPL